MFDLAEEIVVLAQEDALLVSQATALFQIRHGLQGIAGAKLREVAAVEKLQELDHELDVADATVADLHVAGLVLAVGRLLDSPFEGLDAADVGPAEIAAVNPGRKLLEKMLAQFHVARRRPGLDKRLPLPRPPANVVIIEHGGQGHNHRPPLAVRPQPQVDTVGNAQFGVDRQESHNVAGKLLEELLNSTGRGPSVLPSPS